MAKLSYTFENLTDRISDFLLKHDHPVDKDATKIKDICARAYRQFLYPVDQRTGKEYLWSFLKQYYSLNLLIDKWKYALPENFSEILTDPVFSDENQYYSLIKKSPEWILDARVSSVTTAVPSYYAITPSAYSLDTGTYYEFWIYGEPSTTYTLQFFYKIDPLKPEATSDYLVGGIKAVEAIIENCYAIAEQQELHTIGVHSALAARLTQNLIIADSNMENKVTLGNLYDGGIEPYVRGDNATFSLSNLFADEYTFTEP